MDTVNQEMRSRIMSSVAQNDTGPELALRRALHKNGIRYRLHDRRLPGSPDIVLPKHHAVVFVHGCFWHRHDCKYTTTPSSNRQFWEAKFAANVARDKNQYEKLFNAGWRIATVWQCSLKEKAGASIIASGIQEWLGGSALFAHFPVSAGDVEVADAVKPVQV